MDVRVCVCVCVCVWVSEQESVFVRLLKRDLMCLDDRKKETGVFCLMSGWVEH